MGDYFPSAPVDDGAKKRNQNLPGQGGVFNYVNLHAYHYAGNNPVKYTDPDGETPRESLKNFIDATKNVAQTVASTAVRTRQAVWNAVNSGEHVVETPTNKPVNNAKAFYASAAADMRLAQLQLNLDAEFGGANYSTGEKKIAETRDSKFGLGLEGSVTALSGKAFTGLKDTSIGTEAGVAIVSFSGSINVHVYCIIIKGGGSFEIGTLEKGESYGFKMSIREGRGLGGSLFLQIVLKSTEVTQ